MSKYTKGPWKIQKYANHDAECIISDNQIKIMVADYDAIPNKADRTLIAAAPDLLEACKLVRDFRTIHHKYPDADSMLMDKLNAAITKAEGKES